MMTHLRPSHSISRKLLVMMMAMAFFAAMVTAGVLSAYEFNTAKKTQTESLTAIAKILAPNLTAALLFQDSSGAQELIKPLLKRKELIHAKVLVNDTLFVAVHGERQEELSSETVITVRVPLAMEGDSYGFLELSVDNSYIEQRVSFYQIFLVLLLVGTLALSFGLSLFLSKPFIQPLLHLASVAEKVTRTSNYSLRATRFHQDEIGDLTQYFNSMLETIEYRENLLESLVLERTRELERVNSKLHDQAYRDSLSGLPNRLFLYEKLHNLLSDNQQTTLSFALMFIDLDGFKEVNDTLGHDMGDVLLIEASKRILECVRGSDVVARLGGDEFTVVIKGVTHKERINQIAENILNRLSDSFTLNGELAFVSGSIGITLFPEDGNSVDTLVKHADQAMYESKNQGRNCYHYYTPEMEDQAMARRALVEALREGIRLSQFELFYQPIVNLATQRVDKAEALIRWRHPQRGMVPPLEFIPVAEEVGLIDEIGEWVANKAIADLARWQQAGLSDFHVSINASPAQLKEDCTWLTRWFDRMNQLGIRKHSVTLEITEGLLMESNAEIRKRFASLHEHGVSIAIDDFGVGYSSLSYLQQMDIDILKIDRSFIHNLTSESDSLELCKAIIIMAHHLGLLVVAEGIETQAQKQLLIEAGCDYGQGYLFAKPLPCADFERLFIESSIQLFPYKETGKGDKAISLH